LEGIDGADGGSAVQRIFEKLKFPKKPRISKKAAIQKSREFYGRVIGRYRRGGRRKRYTEII